MGHNVDRHWRDNYINSNDVSAKPKTIVIIHKNRQSAISRKAEPDTLKVAPTPNNNIPPITLNRQSAISRKAEPDTLKVAPTPNLTVL